MTTFPTDHKHNLTIVPHGDDTFLATCISCTRHWTLDLNNHTIHRIVFDTKGRICN